MNLLLIGKNTSFLNKIEKSFPSISIYLIEEPQIIQSWKIPLPKVIKSLVASHYQIGTDYEKNFDENLKYIEFDAVIAGVEYAVPAAIAMAHKLNLPNLGDHTEKFFSNKYIMRKELLDSNINQTDFTKIETINELEDFANKYKKTIIKPVNRQGGVGVTVIERENFNANEIWDKIHNLDEGHRYIEREKNDYFIMEKFIEGPVFSTETLIKNGEIIFFNITQQDQIENSHIIKIGHTIPAVINLKLQDEFKKSMFEFIKTLHLDTGVLHTEWILSEEKLVFVECAGRVPGDYIFEMIESSYDFDIFSVYLKLCCKNNSDFNINKIANNISRILYFTAPTGVVTAIQNIDLIDEFKENKIIKDYNISAKIGDKIKTLENCWDRLGHIIISSHDISILNEVSQNMRDKIKIITKSEDEIYDLIGIGIGPFNLSLAALSDNTQLNCLYLEKKDSFSWHNGFMFSHSKMQTHFLKDLVSVVDPTNKYSFTNYLVKSGKINEFLLCNNNFSDRNEFEQYLKWVSINIGSCLFNSHVQEVDFQDKFIIKTEHKNYQATNICFGIGHIPNIPKGCIEAVKSPQVFHSSEILNQTNLNFSGKKILVVGGSQSGAEIFYHLIINESELPSEIVWISKKHSFYSLENSSLSDLTFLPNYENFFFNLKKELREKLIHERINTSNAITPELSDGIFQTLYRLNTQNKIPKIKMISNSYLKKAEVEGNKVYTELEHRTDFIEKDQFDYMILATGYIENLPQNIFLPLIKKGYLSEQIQINNDYSLKSNLPIKNQIFVQNLSLYSHGWSDKNLSTTSYRNAKIINAVKGYSFFKTNFKYFIQYQ